MKNKPFYFFQYELEHVMVSVINELSCMKLIATAEQIGLTWPGTTRRARSILQQPKTQQNHNYCAFTYFNIRGIVKVVS